MSSSSGPSTSAPISPTSAGASLSPRLDTPSGHAKTDPWADLPWSKDPEAVGLAMPFYHPEMHEYYETTRERLVAMGYDIPPIRRPAPAR